MVVKPISKKEGNRSTYFPISKPLNFRSTPRNPRIKSSSNLKLEAAKIKTKTLMLRMNPKQQIPGVSGKSRV